MSPELEMLWNDLAKAREEFLNELNKIPEQKFHQNPDEGWSAAQIVEHILGAESGTLGYMKKKSSGGWDILDRTGDEHTANSKAINSRLASPERYSAPSVLQEPTNQIVKTELLERWSLIRTELFAFIQSIDPSHYDKLVFRQPIAGMLNIIQAMEFMTHHLRHHIPQLERLILQID